MFWRGVMFRDMRRRVLGLRWGCGLNRLVLLVPLLSVIVLAMRCKVRLVVPIRVVLAWAVRRRNLLVLVVVRRNLLVLVVVRVGSVWVRVVVARVVLVWASRSNATNYLVCRVLVVVRVWGRGVVLVRARVARLRRESLFVPHVLVRTGAAVRAIGQSR